MSELEFTGERVVPGKVDDTLWHEHLSRYLFAADFVQGRVVLDAGCGTGYGADLVAAHGAAHVLGIDVSPEAIAYARNHYPRPNVAFEVGDLASLGPATGRFDVVLAFEVIEHLADQDRFLAAVAALLADDGIFLLSTPNRAVYRQGEEPNPFHTRELDRAELRELLRGRFSAVRVLAQRHMTAVLIAPLSRERRGSQEFVLDRSLLGLEPEPPYFVALCGNRPREALEARGKLVEVFADPFSRQLDLTRRDLARLGIGDETVILVDQDELRSVLGIEARLLPFPEHGGEYWGPPADDAEAIAELERLRRSGAAFLVVAWPAFWWLEYYKGMAAHLRSMFACALENDRLVVFDLHAEGGVSGSDRGALEELRAPCADDGRRGSSGM